MTDYGDRPRCGRRKSTRNGKEGGPCQNLAGFRTGHLGEGPCWLHGGLSPQAVKAADRRRQDRDAKEAVRLYGLPLEVDPATALQEEVWRTAGAIRWIEQQIHELTTARDLVQGTLSIRRTDSETQGTTTVTEVGPAINPWVKLLQAERRHLISVCAATLAAGVEERQMRIAEAQGAAMISLIRGILGELHLTAEQKQIAADAVPRHLRSVSGAAS